MMSKKIKTPKPTSGHAFESSFENSPQPLATSSVNRTKQEATSCKPQVKKPANTSAVSSKVTNIDASEISALQKKVNEIKESNKNKLDSKKQKDVLEQLEEIQQSLDEKYRRLSNNAKSKPRATQDSKSSNSISTITSQNRGIANPMLLHSDLLVPGILDFDSGRSRHPSSVSSLGIIDENSSEFTSAFHGVDPDDNFDYILQSRPLPQSSDLRSDPRAVEIKSSMQHPVTSDDKRLTHVISQSPSSGLSQIYQDENCENIDPNQHLLRNNGPHDPQLYSNAAVNKPGLTRAQLSRHSMLSNDEDVQGNRMVAERDFDMGRDLVQFGFDEKELSSRPSLAQSRLSMQRRLAQLCLNEETPEQVSHNSPSRETFDVLSPPSNLVSTDGEQNSFSFSQLRAQQNISTNSAEFDLSGSKFLQERAEQDHEDWVRSHAPLPLLASEMRPGSFSLGGASSVSITPTEYFGHDPNLIDEIEDCFRSMKRQKQMNTTITISSSEERAEDNDSDLDEACAIPNALPCSKANASIGNATQAVMRRYEDDRESVLSTVSSVVSTSQLARILEQHSDLDGRSGVFQDFLEQVSSKNSSKKSSQRSSPCKLSVSGANNKKNPNYPRSVSSTSEDFLLLHNRPDSASSMRDADSPRRSYGSDISRTNSYRCDVSRTNSYGSDVLRKSSSVRISDSGIEYAQNNTVCLESSKGVPPPGQYIFYLTSSHSSSPLTPLALDHSPSRRTTSNTRYSSSLNSIVDSEIDSQDIDITVDTLPDAKQLVRDFQRKLSAKLSDLSGIRLGLNATLLNSTCDEADLTIASLCQSSTRCDLEHDDEKDVQELDVGHLCIGTTVMISKDIYNPCPYLIKCYAELLSVADATSKDHVNVRGGNPNKGDEESKTRDASPALVLFETDRFDLKPGEKKTAKIYIVPLKTGPLWVEYRFRLLHTFSNLGPASNSSPSIVYRTNRVRLISELPLVELRDPEQGSVHFGIRPSRYDCQESVVLVNRGHAKVPLKFVLEPLEGREGDMQGERGSREFRAQSCVDPNVEARYEVHLNTPDAQLNKLASLTGRLQIFVDIKPPIASQLLEEISLLLHHVHLSTRITSAPLHLSVAGRLELQANVPQQISLKNVTNEPLSLKLWIPEDHHEEFRVDPNYISRTQLNKVYSVQIAFHPRDKSHSNRNLILMIDYNPRSPQTHCIPIQLTGVVSPSQLSNQTLPATGRVQNSLSQCESSKIPTSTPSQFYNKSNDHTMALSHSQSNNPNIPERRNPNIPERSHPCENFCNPSAVQNETPSSKHTQTPGNSTQKSVNFSLQSDVHFSSDPSYSSTSSCNPTYCREGFSGSEPERSGTPLNHSLRARHLRSMAPSPSLSVASADGSPLELDCTRSHISWTARGGNAASVADHSSNVTLKLRNRNLHREKLRLALMNKNHCFKILNNSDTVTELKFSLSPMEVRDVTVQFLPSTSQGAMCNAIVITRVSSATHDEEVPKRVIPLYGFSGKSKVDISGVQKDINQRMIISLTASSVQTLFTLSNSGQAPAFALLRSSNSRLIKLDSPDELLLTPNSEPQIVELSLVLSEFATAGGELVGKATSDVVEIGRVTVLYGEESARARLKRIVPPDSAVLKDYPYLSDMVSMFNGEVFCNTKKLRDTQEMLRPLYTKDISQVTIGILMDKSDIELIQLDTTVVFEELNSTLYKTHLPSE